jgi:hypothetical protein
MKRTHTRRDLKLHCIAKIGKWCTGTEVDLACLSTRIESSILKRCKRLNQLYSRAIHKDSRNTTIQQNQSFFIVFTYSGGN